MADIVTVQKNLIPADAGPNGRRKKRRPSRRKKKSGQTESAQSVPADVETFPLNELPEELHERFLGPDVTVQEVLEDAGTAGPVRKSLESSSTNVREWEKLPHKLDMSDFVEPKPSREELRKRLRAKLRNRDAEPEDTSPAAVESTMETLRAVAPGAPVPWPTLFRWALGRIRASELRMKARGMGMQKGADAVTKDILTQAGDKGLGLRATVQMVLEQCG
jgi:hypothetical protein